jgi:hypothetical protein
VLLACGLAIAGRADTSRAEDDVLKLVPQKALGFVVVNRPAEADAKLQQMGRAMNLPIPSLLAKLQGPEGLIRQGLDKKRPVAFVVLPPQGENPIPAMVALIPVNDYAKFLEQFKPEDKNASVAEIKVADADFVVRRVGGYAAITSPLFRESLEKEIKLADEVPAALAAWRPWLAKKDAAAIVLAPGIHLLSAKVQQGIATIKPALAQAGEQAKQAGAVFDMYVTFFQAAEKEVAAFGIGAERDAQGTVRFSKRARLVSGGDWARFIAEGKLPKQDVLAGLPDGPFVFAGGGPLPGTATAKMMEISFGMIKNMHELYGLSQEQAEMIGKLSKEKFPQIHGMSFVLGVGESGEPIFSRMLGIMRVNNSKTFLTDYKKYAAHYNEIVEKINSPMFRPIELESREVDGSPALKVVMAMPQMPNMPAESVKMMERMYGPGGKIVAWIVPCKEDTVVFSYMGEERLRGAIASIKEGKPGLEGNAEVAKAAALLPKDATWVGYLSLNGTCDFIKQMVAAVPAASGVKFPTFGRIPPLAIALTTGPDYVEVQQIFPAEVVKEIGGVINKYFTPQGALPPAESQDLPVPLK